MKIINEQQEGFELMDNNKIEPFEEELENFKSLLENEKNVIGENYKDYKKLDNVKYIPRKNVNLIGSIVCNSIEKTKPNLIKFTIKCLMKEKYFYFDCEIDVNFYYDSIFNEDNKYNVPILEDFFDDYINLCSKGKEKNVVIRGALLEDFPKKFKVTNIIYINFYEIIEDYIKLLPSFTKRKGFAGDDMIKLINSCIPIYFTPKERELFLKTKHHCNDFLEIKKKNYDTVIVELNKQNIDVSKKNKKEVCRIKLKCFSKITNEKMYPDYKAREIELIFNKKSKDKISFHNLMNNKITKIFNSNGSLHVLFGKIVVNEGKLQMYDIEHVFKYDCVKHVCEYITDYNSKALSKFEYQISKPIKSFKIKDLLHSKFNNDLFLFYIKKVEEVLKLFK